MVLIFTQLLNAHRIGFCFRSGHQRMNYGRVSLSDEFSIDDRQVYRRDYKSNISFGLLIPFEIDTERELYCQITYTRPGGKWTTNYHNSCHFEFILTAFILNKFGRSPLLFMNNDKNSIRKASHHIHAPPGNGTAQLMCRCAAQTHVNENHAITPSQISQLPSTNVENFSFYVCSARD